MDKGRVPTPVGVSVEFGLLVDGGSESSSPVERLLGVEGRPAATFLALFVARFLGRTMPPVEILVKLSVPLVDGTPEESSPVEGEGVDIGCAPVSVGPSVET